MTVTYKSCVILVTDVSFGLLTAATKSVFWEVTSCSMIEDPAFNRVIS